MNSIPELLIITASNGENLKLAEKLKNIANEMELKNKLIDLTEYKIPLYNPRIHKQYGVPNEIQSLTKVLNQYSHWIICAPEYNGSIPPILTSLIAWLSVQGDDFRTLFNGRPIALATHSGGAGIELIVSLRIQLTHLGAQVLGRHLSSSNSNPVKTKSMKEVIFKLSQMKKLSN
tara:strand:+ start:648 stop:1172 length:525 start_codon:yes stop_codon:yes gene_type:complete